MTSEQIKAVVAEHSAILGSLVPLRDTDSQRKQEKIVWKAQAKRALQHICHCLGLLLKDEAFSLKIAEELQTAVRNAWDSLSDARDRISEEVEENARVYLSTIGSSHKIPVEGQEGNESGIVRALDRLRIGGSSVGRRTIVVFDEAGCIPCYELLGLSRIGRNIEALVCVGDKHQLSPYDPQANFSPKRGTRFTTATSDDSKIKSLLDVRALSQDADTKVKLTTQYRVPRDIANLLNDRIYKGNYKTALECGVPMKGFHFIDVPEESRYGRENEKYVNKREIARCIELVQARIREGFDSLMVLTPVSPRRRIPRSTCTDCSKVLALKITTSTRSSSARCSSSSRDSVSKK